MTKRPKQRGHGIRGVWARFGFAERRRELSIEGKMRQMFEGENATDLVVVAAAAISSTQEAAEMVTVGISRLVNLDYFYNRAINEYLRCVFFFLLWFAKTSPMIITLNLVGFT